MLVGGLLAAALFVGGATAQTQTAPAPAPAARDSNVSTTGQWRASKLVGLDVYNEQNEKLGDIRELLIDRTGKVTGVVIGIGGFLGLGEHDILVTMDKLKFVDEPQVTGSTATSGPATGSGVSTTRPGGETTSTSTSTTSTTTSTTRTANRWYPDHAILPGATKEQLKSMPEFKFD
jgi:sporulation protein YlmC with PRC-barrel domain